MAGPRARLLPILSRRLSLDASSSTRPGVPWHCHLWLLEVWADILKGCHHGGTKPFLLGSTSVNSGQELLLAQPGSQGMMMSNHSGICGWHGKEAPKGRRVMFQERGSLPRRKRATHPPSWCFSMLDPAQWRRG